jgi:dCMP deaminase
MKQKFVDYYMKVAELTSTLSYAKRLQVGSVIVKGNKILATGYNGMPSGWDNTCETTEIVELDEKFIKQLVTKQEVLHAEMNALMKVSQSTESSAEAIMFCTHAPCINCAKAMHQAGIVEVIYKNTYRTEEGLYFLEKCGVKLTKYVENDK